MAEETRAARYFLWQYWPNKQEQQEVKREGDEVEDGLPSDQRSVQQKEDITECKDQTLQNNDEEWGSVYSQDDNTRRTQSSTAGENSKTILIQKKMR